MSFRWGIDSDVLRRLDAVLEHSKAKVRQAKARLDAAEIKEPEAALRAAAGQAFYNISAFVLRNLTKFLAAQVELNPAAPDNHAKGMVVEDGVSRFNEKDNEEAGQQRRDAMRCGQ